MAEMGMIEFREDSRGWLNEVATNVDFFERVHITSRWAHWKSEDAPPWYRVSIPVPYAVQLTPAPAGRHDGR
jgi:hypothetical protein